LFTRGQAKGRRGGKGEEEIINFPSSPFLPFSLF
jgi:hypothetical protein